jgi:hypothetical protein
LAAAMAEKCITDEESPRDHADYNQEHGIYYPFPDFSPSKLLSEAAPYYEYAPPSTFMNIYDMAKDQIGCRVLQKRLEDGQLYDINEVFTEVIDYIPGLLIDPFGNYLCQKLMEVVDSDQLLQIIKNLTPHILEIGVNMHGTRAIQKLIEVVRDEE